MSLGIILLIVFTVLVLFGIGQRVLDKLYLKDWQAVIIMLAILGGSLIPDIRFSNTFSINIGGALIPFALCVYVFIKADSGRERLKAIGVSILVGALVYVAGALLPSEPELMIIDPNYIYGLLAGITAYLFGRSRRLSFVTGVLGVMLADIAIYIMNVMRGNGASLALGGAGAMDAIVISGFLALLLADIIGEIRERIQGGQGHEASVR